MLPSPADKLLLSLADNGLVMNHRLCEWCTKAPSLELEMGLANIGLDHLGQARLWLESVAPNLNTSEDELAYFRDENNYYNLLLVEQQNGDFAFTIAKLFLYDYFHLHLLEKLSTVADKTIAAVAEKSLLEVRYHVKFSTHWMNVMVGGTNESVARMRDAIEFLWQFCGEFFTFTDYEQTMYNKFNLPAAQLKERWLADILPPLAALELPLDTTLPFYQPSGKNNNHSEQLGFLLAEMQVLARKHPGETW
ncbi:MAG: phenylacetate-CoA oxygenase subunit PaaC [Proteobacteria bacterium]|nr:phenylacetate-CoA oxygenase subunit PaaC [Pseudomonadota bacterium]